MPDNTSSWLWWVFSTVLVAIVINLSSDYLRPRIDALWSKFSAKRRKMSELESAKIEAAAVKMLSSSEEANYIFHSYQRWLTIYVFYMLVFFQFYFFAIVGANTSIKTDTSPLGQGIPVATIFLICLPIYYLSRKPAAKIREFRQIIEKYREQHDSRNENLHQ